MNYTMSSHTNALNTSTNLTTQNSFVIALERLSSTLRSSKSKREAEKWVNTNVFTKPLNELDQAVRNANDGVSLVQTAVKALREIRSHLQHMHSLATQSSLRNSAEERAVFNQEIHQHLTQIDHLASHTHFNGLHLLTGKFGKATFQVGSAVDEIIAVNLSTGVRTNQMGQIPTKVGSRVTANALPAGAATIAVGGRQPVMIGASVAGLGAGQTADSAYAKAQAINQLSIAGLQVTASTDVTGSFTSLLLTTSSTYGLILNGVRIFHNYDLQNHGPLKGEEVVKQINLYSIQTGVSASFNGNTSQITLTATDGRNIAIRQTISGKATGGFDNVLVGQTADGLIHRGVLFFNANESISFTGEYSNLGITDPMLAKDERTLTHLNVLSEANAKDAILRIQSALFTIDELLSNLEGIQSRFYSVIHNLETVSRNLPTSRDGIHATNVALEVASAIRRQISQYPSIALLVQANSTPPTVLKLLS